MSEWFENNNDSQHVLDERRFQKLMYQTSSLSIGFRNQMLLKISDSLKQSPNRYENLTDDEIQQEIQNQQMNHEMANRLKVIEAKRKRNAREQQKFIDLEKSE